MKKYNYDKLLSELDKEEIIKSTTSADLNELYIPKVVEDIKNIKLVHKSNYISNNQANVCFPYFSTLASSFDKNLLYDFGKTIALDRKSKNLDLILGPSMNLKRNPLCGRNFEYFSEDPVLSGKLAASFIRGIEDNGCFSAPKHYILNNIESGKYTSSSNVDEKAFNEIYLKNFKVAIEEGKPSFIMTSSNKVNHNYVNESKDLLSIPRNDWGFDGLYISDINAISNKNESIISGNDIELTDKNKKYFLSDEAYSNAQTSLTKLFKILSNKRKVVSNNLSDDELHQYSTYLSSESIILAKNDDNLLPIDSSKSVSIVGRISDIPCSMEDDVIPYKVDKFTQEFLKYNKNIYYVEGYDSNNNTSDYLLDKVVKTVSKTDYVIVFVGQSNKEEGISRDRSSLDLNESMNKLVDTIYDYNKNIILVVETGSPVSLPFYGKCKSILIPYYSGESINSALALIISGIISPSGRFPESWPWKYEDVPSNHFNVEDYKDQYYTESIYIGYRFYDKADIKPMFNFGDGLSYANFKLSNFSYKKDRKGIKFKVKIKNISNVNGSTPILLYSSKGDTDTFRPVKELIDFNKVFLTKGESTTLDFYVPYDYLKSYDLDSSKMVLESGQYLFSIGTASSKLTLSKKVNIKSKDKFYLNQIFTHKNYYSISESYFPLDKFESIYNKALVDTNPYLSINSLLNDFDINSNSIKFKNDFINKIQSKIINAKLNKYDMDSICQFPIRILNNYYNIYNDEYIRNKLESINKEIAKNRENQ